MDEFNFDDFEEYNESQEELLERSMDNGYKILSGEITIDELLFTTGIIDLVYLPFDFYKMLSMQKFEEVVQEEMVKYFEDREEFEKCNFLKSMKYSDYSKLFNDFYDRI